MFLLWHHFPILHHQKSGFWAFHCIGLVSLSIFTYPQLGWQRCSCQNWLHEILNPFLLQISSHVQNFWTNNYLKFVFLHQKSIFCKTGNVKLLEIVYFNYMNPKMSWKAFGLIRSFVFNFSYDYLFLLVMQRKHLGM